MILRHKLNHPVASHQGTFTCHDGGNDAIAGEDLNWCSMLCKGNGRAKLLGDARHELGHLSNPFQLDWTLAWISVRIDEPLVGASVIP